MILTQLVKVIGLIQVLCNVSINLSYIIYLLGMWSADKGMPPNLLFNIILLLFLIPGYFSLQKIEDRILQWILLGANLLATILIWMLFNNIVRTAYA